LISIRRPRQIMRKKAEMTRTDRPGGASGDLTEGLPLQRLADETLNFLDALTERVLDSIGERAGESTRKLVDRAREGGGGGGPGLQAAISGMTALVEDKGLVRAGLRAGGTFLKEAIKQLFTGGRGRKASTKVSRSRTSAS
jgi:hypothetical protein